MTALRYTLALAVVFGAGQANAQIAGAPVPPTNTTQNGSLLIFPAIDIDPTEAADTFIEISNDQNAGVWLECLYMNQKKDRNDFTIHLSAKQTVSWFVGSQIGDNATPQPFPGGDLIDLPNTNIYHGELACFAVDFNSALYQIAWNHLSGTAQVIKNPTSPGHKTAYRYDAFAFKARDANNNPAADNTPQGTPGQLVLSTGGAGTYDSCHAYQLTNFSPAAVPATTSGTTTIGGLTTLGNTLHVSSCNQDLRTDTLAYHTTELVFGVWDSNEVGKSAAYTCVDSNSSVVLSSTNTYLHEGADFDSTGNHTPDARFSVSGTSTQPTPSPCGPGAPAPEVAGLLGVLELAESIADTTVDMTVGNTLVGAGLQPGYLLWTPGSAAQLKKAK